ncbi:MAG: hypothetical protein U5L96_16820 [Owenweeksia sp.]|nr:hypothetical protein [Owenweeksia sp.]
MRERGYGPFGQEGLVRQHAMGLLDSGRLRDAAILNLTGLEKDFIRKGDTGLVRQFNNTVNDLQKKIYPSSQTYQLLDDYQVSFNKLVRLDKRIGIHESEGAYSASAI